MRNKGVDRCGITDEKDIVLHFQVALAFINNTTQVWKTGTRSLQFFKTTGEVAFWCYYDFLRGEKYPPTNIGEQYQFTYDVYVEKNEMVGYAIFKVDGVGEARVNMPTDLSMPNR